METRLPAHVEASGLIRAVEAEGGFGMVIAKGERDAGTLLIICCKDGTNCRAYERMPQADGSRAWALAKAQDTENTGEFHEYLERRRGQDPDLWIVELDIVRAERFIGLPGTFD